MVDFQKLLSTVGNFTYCWGKDFFIETSEGNFIWSDPDYPEGDNSLTLFDGSYQEFINSINIPYGRDKGYHVVGDYCGKDVYLK